MLHTVCTGCKPGTTASQLKAHCLAWCLKGVLPVLPQQCRQTGVSVAISPVLLGALTLCSGANELDIGGNNDLDVCLELADVGDSKEERGEW